MIVITYDKATGRVAQTLTAPNIDLEDYDTVDQGAVEVPEMPVMGRTMYFMLPVTPGDAPYYIPMDGEVGYPTEENYYWDHTVWGFVPDVAAATSAATARVKLGQDAMKFGDFEWSGYTFQGDDKSQGQINGYALKALIADMTSTAFSVDWVLADNSTVTLDSTSMLGVFAALNANVEAAQAQGVALRADIATAAAITPANLAVTALNDIVWVAP